MKNCVLPFLVLLLLFSACGKKPGAILSQKKMVYHDQVYPFSRCDRDGLTYHFGNTASPDLQFVLSDANNFNSFSIIFGRYSYGISVSGSEMYIKYAGGKTYKWDLNGEPGNFGLGNSDWDLEKITASSMPDIPGLDEVLPKKQELQGDDPGQVAALAIAFNNAAYFNTRPFYSNGSIFVRFCVFIGGILFFFLGRYFASNPEDAWNMSEGWKFRNSEPSDLWLAGNSISSYILMGLGALAAVLAWIIPG